MQELDWDRALTLLSPHNYALLSTQESGGRANLMGLGWWTVVSWSPPKVVVSVGQGQHSRECLDQVPEFVLNFPNAAQAKGAWLCGTVSGRDGDKFRMAGFTPLPSTQVRPPRVDGCTVAFECRVTQRIVSGDHVLYIADIVAMSGNPDAPMHLYSIHYNKLVGLDHELNATDTPGQD
jgi:flavin reductase (DIM6/NTAB) family NADH-FMN oxidoreductase RutF